MGSPGFHPGLFSIQSFGVGAGFGRGGTTLAQRQPPSLALLRSFCCVYGTVLDFANGDKEEDEEQVKKRRRQKAAAAGTEAVCKQENHTRKTRSEEKDASEREEIRPR
jgi:hypothetical protein